MQSTVAALVVFASLVVSACRSDGERGSPERGNAERALARVAPQPGEATQTIRFQHQDASLAANHARREFGNPPMEGVVRVVIDTRTNSWVVHAIPADMARVTEIAARYDVAGDPVWWQKQE